MKPTNYLHKETKKHYLYYEKYPLYSPWLSRIDFLGNSNKEERIIKEDLMEFFFERFLINFLSIYIKNEELEIKVDNMRSIRMKAYVEFLDTFLYFRDKAMYTQSDPPIVSPIFLFEINHLYERFKHLISKENFKKGLNILIQQVIFIEESNRMVTTCKGELIPEPLFKVEFFFKEEEPFKHLEEAPEDTFRYSYDSSLYTSYAAEEINFEMKIKSKPSFFSWWKKKDTVQILPGTIELEKEIKEKINKLITR